MQHLALDAPGGVADGALPLAAAQGGVHQQSVWGAPRAHEALALVLPLLPLGARWRAAGVCTVWRGAAAPLWAELRLEADCLLSDVSLAALCARCGALLRTLDLAAVLSEHVTAAGVLAALRAGGCTGVLHLSLPCVGFVDEHAARRWTLTSDQALQLAAACPVLKHAACLVCCDSVEDTLPVATALRGPLTLDLFHKQIDDAGAATLADVVRQTTTITSLNLGGNNFGNAGVAALAAALPVQATVTCLRMDAIHMTAAGVISLAEALRVDAMRGLTSLDIGSNRVFYEGATALANALRTNKTLTFLSLYDSEVGHVGGAALAAALRTNRTLKILDLNSNAIDDAGAAAFAEALRMNTTLTSLRLRETDVGDDAAAALRAALPAQCVLDV